MEAGADREEIERPDSNQRRPAWETSRLLELKSRAHFCGEFLNLQHLVESILSQAADLIEARTRQRLSVEDRGNQTRATSSFNSDISTLNNVVTYNETLLFSPCRVSHNSSCIFSCSLQVNDCRARDVAR